MQVLGIAVLFAAAATAAGAQSDDDAYARTQGGQLDSYQLIVWSDPYGPKEYSPAIHVRFENPVPDAKDEAGGDQKGGLGFAVEWTANGEVQPPDLKSRGAKCKFTSPALWCTALGSWFGPPARISGYRTPVWVKEFPQGFHVVNLEYDTRYCFRLQVTAFNLVAGQDVTGPWSRWTCARTQPAPPPIPLPTAPLQPNVTLLPATDGIGVPGGPLPIRALVEWEVPGEKPSENITFYAVEKAWLDKYTPNWRGVENINATADRAETTLTFPAGEEPTDERRYLIRVCSENPTGRRCSPAKATSPFYVGPLAPKRPKREYPADPERSTTDGSAPGSTDRAAPSLPTSKANLPKAVKPQPRVRPGGTPTSASRPICDLASQARVRNSPAAPGLEAKCVDDLANKGGAIAETDSAVASARRAEADASYRLGFDIATGIFGDAALGAWGNTATGPVSLKIRAGLTAAGQRGFDAAVKFHEDRR